MRATFAGIEIGRTGLNVSQLGLDVTGHNIANVETAGYTRQRIVQTAYDPFSTIGRALPVSEALVGGGVRVKILDQIRSAYLDRRYRTENTINSYWQKRTEGLTYLESYFDNVVEETSLNYSVAKFFEAIKVLAEDPVEGSPRKLLQTAGADLAQQLHTIYEGLIDLQESQNLAVKVTVDDINRIADEIVDLDKSIYAFEATGYVANDLRDKRNLLLDELSALIDIEYREVPDGRGNQRLIVEIGGKALVDHDQSYKLDVEAGPNPIAGEADVWIPIWATSPHLVPKMDSSGNYNASFTGLDAASPTTLVFTSAVDTTDPDAVQAAVDRINEIAARFAKITPIWNDFAADYATYEALAAYVSGSPPGTYPAEEAAMAALEASLGEPLDLINELKGLIDNVDIFEMTPNPWDWCVHTGLTVGGASLVYACSDEVKPQSARAIVSVDSDVEYDPSEPLEVNGGELKAYIDMRDSMETKTPGIPYYIEMLNNLARALAQEVNEIHREGWTDTPSGSLTGVDFFGAKDSAGNYLAIGLNIGLVTAKNICLSELVEESEYNIACSTKEIVKHGEPNELQRGNNENMNTLYELFLKKDISIVVGGNTIDIGSLDGFVTSIRFDVANTLSFAKKTATNSNTLLLAAENQRISVSGVSLDEEMTNMVKYQHAYSGASRIITAMDEMLDRLINNTGRVGL